MSVSIKDTKKVEMEQAKPIVASASTGNNGDTSDVAGDTDTDKKDGDGGVEGGEPLNHKRRGGTIDDLEDANMKAMKVSWHRSIL